MIVIFTFDSCKDHIFVAMISTNRALLRNQNMLLSSRLLQIAHTRIRDKQTRTHKEWILVCLCLRGISMNNRIRTDTNLFSFLIRIPKLHQYQKLNNIGSTLKPMAWKWLKNKHAVIISGHLPNYLIILIWLLAKKSNPLISMNLPTLSTNRSKWHECL